MQSNSNTSSFLLSRGDQLYRSFLEASSTCTVDDCLVQQWRAYEKSIVAHVATNPFDGRSASIIRTIANNVHSSATSMLALDQDSEKEVARLSDQLANVEVTFHDSAHSVLIFADVQPSRANAAIIKINPTATAPPNAPVDQQRQNTYLPLLLLLHQSHPSNHPPNLTPQPPTQSVNTS